MKLVFAVHDAADPNGAAIGELTSATQKWVRVQYNGDGEGGFTINRHAAQAAWFEPSADPVYIKAYIDSTAGVNIFGFLPESGGDTILAAEEQGAQEYTRTGKGTLSYLADAILFDGDFTNNDAAQPDADGNWRWGTTNLGAILLRQIEEAQARGCFPDLTTSFTRTLDTGSAAWATVAAEYKLPIGMNLREALTALQSAGLIVTMDPNLQLHAWSDHPGTDLSGSIILTPAVNLRDSVERQVQASPAISTVLVQGDLETGALKFRVVNDAAVLADIGRRKEGYVRYNATPTNAVLDRVGHKAIDSTKAQYDGPTSVPVLIRPGETPFDDYYPGDLIGVALPGAAGSIRVAAIALTETETGEVDPVLELGEETFDPIEGLGSGPSAGSRGPGGTGGTGGGGGPGGGPQPPIVNPCGMTDTFNRANGPVGVADCGVVWSLFTGSPQIETGRLHMGTGGVDHSIGLNHGTMPTPYRVSSDFELTGTNIDTFNFGMVYGEVKLHPDDPPNGVEVTLGTISPVEPFTFLANTPYTIRIEYSHNVADSETTIRVRIWEQADAEPAAWLIDETVPDAETPGYNPFEFDYNFGGVAPTDSIYLDNLDIEGLDLCSAVPFDDMNRTEGSSWGDASSGPTWIGLALNVPSLVDSMAPTEGTMRLSSTTIGAGNSGAATETIAGSGPWSDARWEMTTSVEVINTELSAWSVICGEREVGWSRPSALLIVRNNTTTQTIAMAAGVFDGMGMVPITMRLSGSTFTAVVGGAQVSVTDGSALGPDDDLVFRIGGSGGAPSGVGGAEGHFGPIDFASVNPPVSGQWVREIIGVGDGVTTLFHTTNDYVAGTIQLTASGLDEHDFTETSSTSVTFGTAPFSGEVIRAEYQAS